MSNITYFVVLAFVRTEDGIVAEQALELPSRASAIGRARALALSKAGAVAFARTGDPAIGEFSDAQVLASFGDVPKDLSEY